jgi:hypothetical protein
MANAAELQQECSLAYQQILARAQPYSLELISLTYQP